MGDLPWAHSLQAHTYTHMKQTGKIPPYTPPHFCVCGVLFFLEFVERGMIINLGDTIGDN